MKTLALLLTFALTAASLAAEEPVSLQTASGTLSGSLVVPPSSKPMPVVLLIAGSGPTDRNGNSAMLPGANNALKMLAEGLSARGIASLRYDKRGIGDSKAAMTAEKDLRFDTYVDDAAAWATRLSHDARFSSVFIPGHSEGALIGTIAAAKAPVRGVISIAGLSRPADVVIRAQTAGMLPPDLAAFSEKALVTLKSGKPVDDVPSSLAVLCRPSVQPYLISWFRFDPAAETRALAAAARGSKLEIVNGMNHVLKMVESDRAKQIASYGDPSLPLAPQVVDAIAGFVTK